MTSECRTDYSKSFLIMRFKVVSTFGDGAFELLAKWVQHDLLVDLTTCAADSHVPRAENAIKFVKERLRAI